MKNRRFKTKNCKGTMKRTDLVGLKYDILDKDHWKIGQITLIIHKKASIENWKAPNNLYYMAIANFKNDFTQYMDEDISAVFVADVVVSEVI